MCYIKKLRYESSGQYSLERLKKNIKKMDSNALNIIKNGDVYTYNLKDESDSDKKRYGFIIGNNYKTPKDLINKEGDTINLYSTACIMWKAIQEQQEQIEQLKKEINNLKGGIKNV